jgi:hypothetical protein
MRRLVACFSVALLVSMAWPIGAAAQLVDPISQTRTVSATADNNPGTPNSVSHSAPGFGAFNATAGAYSFDPNLDPTGAIRCCGLVSSLTHRSIIEPTRLWVDGTGAMYYQQLGGGTASTSLLYDVTFDLTAPSSYGVITFFQSVYGGTFSATLWDHTNAVVFSIGGFQGRAGTLMPGQYRFEVLLSRNGVGVDVPDGSFQGWADMTFTLIPEPGTASLLGLGLALLAARRRYGRTTARV